MNIPQGYLHTHISWFQKNTFSKYCHLHYDAIPIHIHGTISCGFLNIPSPTHLVEHVKIGFTRFIMKGHPTEIKTNYSAIGEMITE